MIFDETDPLVQCAMSAAYHANELYDEKRAASHALQEDVAENAKEHLASLLLAQERMDAAIAMASIVLSRKNYQDFLKTE